MFYVDGEPALLDARGDEPKVSREAASAEVVCRTSRRSIDDLVRGTTDTLTSILEGRIELTGSVGALLKFDDALAAFLHGAVVSLPFVEILEVFRRGIPARGV